MSILKPCRPAAVQSRSISASARNCTHDGLAVSQAAWTRDDLSVRSIRKA
jgi:hypothetical protein